MILEFKRKKEHLLNLLNLINNYFKPLKDKYNWGSNPFYYYAGMNSIHPTFVQEMMEVDLILKIYIQFKLSKYHWRKKV